MLKYIIGTRRSERRCDLSFVPSADYWYIRDTFRQEYFRPEYRILTLAIRNREGLVSRSVKDGPQSRLLMPCSVCAPNSDGMPTKAVDEDSTVVLSVIGYVKPHRASEHRRG